MTIFTFVFKRTFKKPLDVIMILILPILSVFLSTKSWISIPYGFLLYGLLIMFIASKLSRTMMEDREKRIIVRLAAAPISQFRYLIENLIAYTLILTVINAIVILLGVIIYGSVIIMPLKLFLLYTSFSIASIGLSISWYALFKQAEIAYSILGGIYVAIAMIGGMFWPHEIMPEFIQKFILILPTYWFSIGMRHVALSNYEGSFIMTLSILIFFGIAFVLIGSRKRLS